MTADNDGRLAVVTFTSQTGQQSSAEEQEGVDGKARDDKRKSDERILPFRGHLALESNEVVDLDQISSQEGGRPELLCAFLPYSDCETESDDDDSNTSASDVD